MHSWLDSDWAFHSNGSPVPGPVLINRRGETETYAPIFRTTAEELVTFVMARKISAALVGLEMPLPTTIFLLDENDMVTLTARKNEEFNSKIKYYDREPDDATEMVVPFSVISDFVFCIMRQHYESYMEDSNTNDDRLMAGMGIFVLMTSAK